jgi:hypothetical protein
MGVESVQLSQRSRPQAQAGTGTGKLVWCKPQLRHRYMERVVLCTIVQAQVQACRLSFDYAPGWGVYVWTQQGRNPAKQQVGM